MRANSLVGGALRLIAAAGIATGIGAQIRTPSEQFTIAAETIRLAPELPPNRINRDSIAAIAVARNPFRASRAPATVPFDPVAPVNGAPPVLQPPRPRPVLAGILLGPLPAALIDGIPGVEGTRLLRTGEAVGAYRLRSVAADRVTLEGPDTIWVLELRRTFQ